VTLHTRFAIVLALVSAVAIPFVVPRSTCEDTRPLWLCQHLDGRAVIARGAVIDIDHLVASKRLVERCERVHLGEPTTGEQEP